MKEFIYVILAGLIMALLIVGGAFLLHVGNPLGFIPFIIIGGVYLWVVFHL